MILLQGIVYSILFYLTDSGILPAFTGMAGKNGVILFIFLLVFFICYKNSIALFEWVENQTYGTRDYIVSQLEILHIEMDPDKITYLLLFLSFGLSIISFGILTLFGQLTLGIIVAGFLSFIGWKIPKPFVNMLVNKRINLYEIQMVDGLNLLSNGLRAGMSLPQSFGLVVDELPAPISQEFNIILQQTKIGVPLEEAMENMSKRIPTQDNEMFVTSVSILRETGGNLAEVFDTIIEVIRDRVQIKQKISTSTAQGRFQAYFMASMPAIMMLLNYLSDAETTVKAFSNVFGIVALVLAAILVAIGLKVILSIVNIKV